MKIISWNCQGAFRKKMHLLDCYNADIIIIQECENPEKTISSDYKNWKNYLWVGDKPHKGLGIFYNKNLKVEQLKIESNELQLFLPCRINDSFNLYAVWTKKSVEFKYIGQLYQYVQLHKDIIKDNHTVICGDFNSNTCWDKSWRYWNHSEVVKELQELNIHSLYHTLNNEKQGLEKTPTMFMYRNIKKPYHIDFAFLSKKFITKRSIFEIGKPDFWLQHSDHMPLIFFCDV